MTDFQDRPNAFPWPPLIYGGAMALALGLHVVAPLPWPKGTAQDVLLTVGICFVMVAVAIDVWASVAFRRSRTTIWPNRAASTLITDGPFRFSRNPIYLANTLFFAGLGLVFGVGGLVVASLIAALITQKLAIEREERHLALRFGKEWDDYAARTPRWLL